MTTGAGDIPTDPMPAISRRRAAASRIGTALDRADGWSNTKTRLVSVAVLAVGLLLWEALARAEVISPIVLPAPSAIIAAAVSLFGSGFLYQHLWNSMLACILGFLVGSSLALLVGIPLGSSGFLGRVFSPFIVVFQAVPKVTLAPLFIVALGFGMTSKVVMASLVCFFPVFVNTVAGLTYLDKKAVNLMRSLGASRWPLLTMLALPSALPSIFAGLKAATTLAVIGVVVSELIGSNSGLGFLVALNTFQLRTATVYVLIGLYGILGWLLYLAVDTVSRKVLFWHAGTDSWRSGN